MERSLVQASTGFPVAPGEVIVAAHGDFDDHLRMPALLAEQLITADNVDRDAARACLNPKTTWARRKDAIENLLWSTRGAPITLIDIDALGRLATSPEATRADSVLASFLPELRWWFERLVNAIDRGGWRVLRPAADSRISQRLEELRVEFDAREPATSDSLSRRLEALPPIVADVLAALTTTGARREVDVERFLDEALASEEDAADVALEMAYGTLTRAAREVAWHCAVARGPQPLNGRIGGFALATETRSPTQLNASLVDGLVKARWLTRATTGVVMHERLRRFLHTRSKWAVEGGLIPIHKHLSKHRVAQEGLPDTLERHHHAIKGRDAQTAMQTAAAYATDLRALGFELSVDGRFEEAAEVYRSIVDQFDAEDSYAWQYFAYNLARARNDDRSAEDASEIEAAYARAVLLEPSNPLYHGRLVGFRAEMGRNIGDDFGGLIGRFAAHANHEAVGYLAKPVFDGLRRAGRDEDANALRERWSHVVGPSSR